MSSIWIFLLDRSGSMGESFKSSPPSPSDPLAEIGSWRSKLDSAKDVLTRQIARINPQQDISIIAFNSSHQNVFRGSATSFTSTVLSSITASSGTNLSGALDGIIDDHVYQSYRSVSLLVITDGLPDNLVKAVRSAERLIQSLRSIRIDVILIDDTQRGRETAQAIALNGSVTYAYSESDVQQQAKGAQIAGVIQQLKASTDTRLALRQELSQLTGSPSIAALRVPSIKSMTSNNLRTQVVPLIEVIESIEQTRCDLTQSPYKGQVIDIGTSSPVQISTAGMAETIRTVVDFITPRGRELRYRERELEQKKAELEIKLKELEIENERNLEERRQRDYEREEELHQLELRLRYQAHKIDRKKFQLSHSVYEIFTEMYQDNDIDPEPFIARLKYAIDRFL
ncbi:MAG: VWA domain-containing protein [Cyanobacteria bacterium P01_G01_bin.54]